QLGASICPRRCQKDREARRNASGIHEGIRLQRWSDPFQETANSMILGLLGIAVSLAIGYFVCALIWPSDVSPDLAIFFAPATGIGLCSLLFIVFRRPFFGVECAVLLVLAVAWFASGKPSAPELSFVGKWRPPTAYLLLACALGMALSYSI